MAEIQKKRLRVAGLNHESADLILGDLRDTWPLVVESFKTQLGDNELVLLSACPPCQSISSLNSRRGYAQDIRSGARDRRNLLVLPIIEVARALKPRLVVVENVPAFLKRKIPHPTHGSGVSAANLLLECLDADYIAFPFLSDLAHYGVPQRRIRTFLTLVRRDLAGLKQLVIQRRAPYPRPSHDPDQGGRPQRSLGQYLRMLNLPSLDARSPKSAISEVSPLHRVPIWSQHHFDMVDAIPARSGQSAWENCVCSACGTVDVQPEDAGCPNCSRPLLRPVVGNVTNGYRLVKGFRTTSYRRMDPDKPAPTVTTASGTIGSARTIHPTETRVLSPLECAHLQTIPDDFMWSNGADWKIEPHSVRRMIGEAVPPKFTALHGQALVGVLENRWPFPLISMYDSRCITARSRLDIDASALESSKIDC